MIHPTLWQIPVSQFWNQNQLSALLFWPYGSRLLISAVLLLIEEMRCSQYREIYLVKLYSCPVDILHFDICFGRTLCGCSSHLAFTLWTYQNKLYFCECLQYLTTS